MFFSVVIPLYNKEKVIARTLRSVFAQTLTDFEIVIVDDGSTDGSVAAVEALADPRIRIIRQQNAGVSAARNRGIAEARGQYISLLDGDDLWKPDYLATVKRLIEKYPDCQVFAVKYEFQNEYGKTWPTQMNRLPFSGEDGEISNYFEVASHSDPPIWSSAVTVKREILQSFGGFKVGLTSGEDLLAWAELAAQNRVVFTTRVLAIYYSPTTGPTGIVPVDLKTTKDAVGAHLIELNKRFPDKNIKEYIAFWYKMRGAINLRRNSRIAAVKCALKSISFKFFAIQPWGIIGLSIMPMSLIKKF